VTKVASPVLAKAAVQWPAVMKTVAVTSEPEQKKSPEAAVPTYG
jgi:hypothetical protein